MLEVNFWQDKAKSQKVIKEKKLYEDLINSYEESTLQSQDLDDLYKLAIEEKNSEIQSEVYQKLKALKLCQYMITKDLLMRVVNIYILYQKTVLLL